MTKSFVSAVLVVLALLGQAKTASAQAICWGCIPGDTLEDIYYIVRGDNVGLVTAQNVRMVRDLTGQLPRSLYGDLMMDRGYYGVRTDGGFHPMYDRNMRPMGRREATVTGAAIGSAIGYGVTGNMRGTAIGAAGGAIVGLLTHRGNSNNQRDNGTVVVPPPPLPQGRQDGGYRPNTGPIFAPPSTRGEWRVTNRTSKRAELGDGDKLIARLEPGQSIQVPAPETSYQAVLLIPNRSGGLDRAEAQIRTSINFNGWDIVAPAVQ